MFVCLFRFKTGMWFSIPEPLLLFILYLLTLHLCGCLITEYDSDKLTENSPLASSQTGTLYPLNCYTIHFTVLSVVESSVTWQQRARVICQPQSSDSSDPGTHILSPLSDRLSTKEFSSREKNSNNYKTHNWLRLQLASRCEGTNKSLLKHINRGNLRSWGKTIIFCKWIIWLIRKLTDYFVT